MTWITNEPVDVVAAHHILTTLGADYVLIHRAYSPGERAAAFWEQAQQNQTLYSLRNTWGDIAVFEVLPNPSASS